MLSTEREKIENTHYKLIRFEIKRPAEFIKKKLIESREQFDALPKENNILEEREPERKRAFSQENIANRNDDTLQGAENSQSEVGGHALSQCVNGNEQIEDGDETQSEDSVIGGKIKELLYNSEVQLRNLN